jgi:Uma2 family endonuclease
MSVTLSREQKRKLKSDVPLLFSGDQLAQPEFHRRYEAYPNDTRFELINGIVYMMAPAGYDHGQGDYKLTGLLFLYEGATPGVEGAQNVTIILSDEDEPQPDGCMMLRPECGGKCRIEGGKIKYIVGAPELMIEVAHSSVALDLSKKRPAYARAGVLEYIVLDVGENNVHWFDLRNDNPLELPPDGILRSFAFPGLWIDSDALIKRNVPALIKCMNFGLQSPEHAAFVQRLEATSKTSGIGSRPSSIANPLKPRGKKKNGR